MKSGVPASSSREERAVRIRTVLWIVLGLNALVAAAEITLGLLTNSMVILADGVHSISDGASNIVGLVGISIAAHPADKNHPYGHRKFETIAALIVAFALFFASISIVRECLSQFSNPVLAEVTPMSFVVMAATLVVNVFITWWERRKGKELRSDLLIADSWHTFADILVKLAAIAALVATSFGIPRVDIVIALGIGVFIAWIAIQVLIRSSHVLADRRVLDEEGVKELVLRIDGVRDCHEIRSRGRADDVRVDLHVLVDAGMTVSASHRLANVIERDIRLAFDGVSEVLVHIEPVDHDHAELDKLNG